MTSSINEKIVEQIKAKKAETKIQEAAQVEEVKRARDDKGHYIADDLSTPDVNEAWEGGKAPKKKAKKTTTKKKTTAKKKTVAKKKTTKK
tara:strand:+ start:118 stop:387 length:270 start_codon:yes stop_codon:yes gene_type:complete